ncbi:S-layer homology domain-containing protein [Anaerotignum sp.]|uniref:GLUG motif-containing protein n=1 Tax=Anaerotignum sp. TaxID=2039241 RepID=UPI003320DC85
MRKNKIRQKLAAIMLSVIMVVGMLPISAQAEPGELSIGARDEIIAFEALRSDIAVRSVLIGTTKRDLELPGTLTATIRIAALEEEPMLDSAETDVELDSADTVSGSTLGIDEIDDTEAGEETALASPSDEQEEVEHMESELMRKTVDRTDEITIPLPVIWASSPEYDGETAGTYVFTPELLEGYSIASSVEVPIITVEVSVTVPIETVTTFDELPEDFRWQNTTTPDFPETVCGTVHGEMADIPVIWEADHDYDLENPQPGLYVFTTVLGEGYCVADGVELPRITLYIPRTAGRMARMAGGDTADSPLEITTAAQFAEIGTLVNARENGLELFLFNNAGAKISLKMINDLDLSAYAGGEGWVPIGNKSNQFKGIFDGGGHKISNLTIDRSDGDHQGLFGYIGANSLVKNLGVENVNIIAKGYIGGVVGEVRGGTVQNCYTTGSIYSGTYYAGGVAGCIFENGTLQNCYTTVSIDGSSGTFSFMIGGLVGGVYDSTVINCYATGRVNGHSSSSSTYTGGLTGYLVGEESTMKHCAALNPAVSGRDRVGRVVGSWPAEFPVGNSQLSSNFAFDGMTVTKYGYIIPPAEGEDQMDGESKTAADISAAGFFETLFCHDTAWTYAEGKLPGFGAAIVLPTYLTEPITGLVGAGTSTDPYRIYTAADLKYMADMFKVDRDSSVKKYYRLENDIDLSSYGKDYEGGKGWVPIEAFVNAVFDGNGKTISQLYINRSNETNIGLFGQVIAGTIRNLFLEGISLHGDTDYSDGKIGGLAGQVSGGSTISGCAATGSITGAGKLGSYCSGGLVGLLQQGSTLNNCTFYGTVSAEAKVNAKPPTSPRNIFAGGIVGRLYESAAISNCVSVADIFSAGESAYAGGIAGQVDSGAKIAQSAALGAGLCGNTAAGRIVGEITSTASGDPNNRNYAWCGMDINGSTVSGTSNNLNGEDMDVAAVQNLWTSGTLKCWDKEIWTLALGKLPVLTGLAGQNNKLPSHISGSYFAGAGTSEDDPYLIKTAEDLAKLAELVNAGTSPYADSGIYYKLQNNLELSDYATGEGWTPIGRGSTKPFKGTFDGNDQTITGLAINRSVSDNIGLFGYLFIGSKVHNLRVSDASVCGKENVGGVVGYTWGATVEHCAVSGDISGAMIVGGIVGYVSSSTIQNCYSNGSVTSTGDYVGGIAGRLEYATTTMQGCYSDSTISGKYYIGGVVGEVDGSTVQNCYSTGNVTGGCYVGGFAGSIGSGRVQNCYSTCSVLGTDPEGYVGGVMGVLGSGTVKNCVALNLSINAGAYNYGRVVGKNTTGLLLNNYAFSRIPGTWEDKGLSAKDGADVTSQTLFGGNFWTTSDNWDTAAWDSAVWTFASGKLPILTGLVGQPAEGGLYLRVRDIQYAAVSAMDTLTYNGREQIPPLEIVFDGETLIKNTDYIVSITSTDFNGTSAGTNAGMVTLTFTGIGSFKGTKTATYTIDKAPLTIVSASINPKSYDGTTTAEVGNVSFDGLKFTETLALGVDYTVTGARYNSADAGNNKTVTATVTLTNSATAKNYSLLSDALSISDMIIGKADLSSVESINKRLNYNTAHTNVNVVITGLPKDRGTTSFSGGTVAGDTAIISGTVQGTATGIKFSANVGEIGQTAVIPVTATMQNYEDVVVNVVVILVNKTSVTITGVAVANKVYDGTAIAYVGTPANAQGYIGSYQYVWSSGSVPKDAGNYTLTVKIPDSNADFMGEIEIPFIISPATVTITAKNKSAYVGGTVPTFGESDYTVTGLASGETLNTTPMLAYTTTPDMSKTGTYTIIATGAVVPDNGNYNRPITYITGTLTISNRPFGGGGSSDSSAVIVTTASDKPNSPTQGEIEVFGTVDGKGNVAVSITNKAVSDAFDKALSEAKKNGTEQNGITVVLCVNTGNKFGSNVTVNLPKTVQDIIIARKIVSIIIVVDDPAIRVGIDLAAVQEINKQAKSDVNIIVTPINSDKLTGDAKKVIGSRPVFDLKVNYDNGKAVSNFGTGSVSVTIPYTLGANEKAGNVQAVYVDGNGKVHWLVNSVYDSAEKVLRFNTNHFSTYGIGYKQANPAFSDIAGHWAEEDIAFVVSRGLFSGTSATTFGPNTAMTRGMFVSVLGRLTNVDVSGYKQSSFSDVKIDAYYMGYIEWAIKNSIVSGVGNGEFSPEQSITREQMAVIMSNYAKTFGYILPKVHVENTFADNDKIRTYAKEAVKQIQMAGVISGKNSNFFDPQGTATRAEVSALLCRFVELAISSDTMQS